MDTLYDLLGALPRDDADGLRTAFRRAVKGAHPDLRPGDPDAAIRFRIAQAYFAEPGGGPSGLGVQPVLSAFGTELFPTEIRGQSAAWVRNWFEIAGYVFGPALVGILGDHSTGAIGNIGDTVSLLMIMQLPGIFLIWRHMPETKGRELDELTPEEALLTEAPLT